MNEETYLLNEHTLQSVTHADYFYECEETCFINEHTLQNQCQAIFMKRHVY